MLLELSLDSGAAWFGGRRDGVKQGSCWASIDAYPAHLNRVHSCKACTSESCDGLADVGLTRICSDVGVVEFEDAAILAAAPAAAAIADDEVGQKERKKERKIHRRSIVSPVCARRLSCSPYPRVADCCLAEYHAIAPANQKMASNSSISTASYGVVLNEKGHS